MSGQRLDAQEPYFVHIGFTYACDVKKNFPRVRVKHKMFRGLRKRLKVSKVRPVVQARLDKLKKYWKRACM